MSQRLRSAVWKYFIKIGHDYRAICSVCKRDLSYKTTIANLSSHLKSRHPEHYIAFKNGYSLEESPSGMPPKTNAERQKAYRERLKKEKPEKNEEIRIKHLAKVKANIKKKKENFTENDIEEQRAKWRDTKRRAKSTTLGRKIFSPPHPPTSRYLHHIAGPSDGRASSVVKDLEKKSKYEQRGRIWKYFKYIHDTDTKKAQCKLCDKIFCLNGNTNSLKSHLKSQHHSNYLELYGQRNRSESADNSDNDSITSESSIKFSSEIWGYFEQVEDGSHCTICEKTTENSVEEMRNHLEEDHPGILISILNKKEDDTDAEETYTEVVYLEEEKRTPRTRKRKTSQKQLNETTDITPPSGIESRPDIDTFLSYLGVLLRNVPKESMPKLQLDVISCVLNAQINPQNAKCNCKEAASAASHSEFIIIDSGKVVETNMSTDQ